MNHLEKRRQAEYLLDSVIARLSNLCAAFEIVGNGIVTNAIDEQIDDIRLAKILFSEAHKDLFDEFFASVRKSTGSIIEVALAAGERTK